MAPEKAKSKKSPPVSAAASGGNARVKPVQPDDILAAIVGSNPLPRTQIMVKVWDYIKLHKLQDTTNKRQINADPLLKALFGGKEHVTMFELTKFVSTHVK